MHINNIKYLFCKLQQNIENRKRMRREAYLAEDKERNSRNRISLRNLRLFFSFNLQNHEKLKQNAKREKGG